jgi:hypothetical protein
VKTFEDESRELVKWLMERLEKSYKLPDDGTGLGYPSIRAKQQKADDIEYRCRLKKLKAKHGRT